MDDASKAAIRRYVDDMNPAFLIDEGTTYLKNTPIIKKADRLLDRSQQLVQDGWNKVANSPMGREAIDAVPEGLKEITRVGSGKVMDFGKDIIKEIPSTQLEDGISRVSENKRKQEKGKDVDTFHETFPDFGTLKKSGIDAVMEDDIWTWWTKIRQ